jgi:hypothetical protein
MTFVVHCIDSISFGFNLPDRALNYATIAITTAPGLLWGDAGTGVPSRTLVQANADATTYLGQFARATRLKTIWCLMASPNDLAANTLTGPQCLTQYALLVSTIRGFVGNNRIILCDPLPRTQATMGGGQTLAGFQAGRAAILSAFNSATFPGIYGDVRAAWGADAFFGVDGSENDTTKYPDGVHPSTLVHSAAHMAGYITTAFGLV